MGEEVTKTRAVNYMTVPITQLDDREDSYHREPVCLSCIMSYSVHRRETMQIRVRAITYGLHGKYTGLLCFLCGRDVAEGWRDAAK